MARILYVPKKFGPASTGIINTANNICAEYQAQGYDLTLRQLYYQFVARGFILNKQSEYKRLGTIVNDARLAGQIDWDYLTDRTRNSVGRNQFSDAVDFIDRATRSWFHTDWWKDQDVHVEVWVEKEALAGVVENTTYDYDVRSLACRGYMSQSEQWAAAQRFLSFVKQGKRIVVIHLGDHDPSGVDMSRDNKDRLRTFLYNDMYRAGARDFGTTFSSIEKAARELWGLTDGPVFELRRIALNMDQIEEHDPPPNPAKLTDSRATGYIDAYGDESWELDALPPDVLSTLISDEIESCLDLDRFDSSKGTEGAYRQRIGVLLDEHRELLDLDAEDDEV